MPTRRPTTRRCSWSTVSYRPGSVSLPGDPHQPQTNLPISRTSGAFLRRTAQEPAGSVRLGCGCQLSRRRSAKVSSRLICELVDRQQHCNHHRAQVGDLVATCGTRALTHRHNKLTVILHPCANKNIQSTNPVAQTSGCLVEQFARCGAGPIPVGEPGSGGARERIPGATWRRQRRLVLRDSASAIRDCFCQSAAPAAASTCQVRVQNYYVQLAHSDHRQWVDDNQIRRTIRCDSLRVPGEQRHQSEPK